MLPGPGGLAASPCGAAAGRWPWRSHSHPWALGGLVSLGPLGRVTVPCRWPLAPLGTWIHLNAPCGTSASYLPCAGRLPLLFCLRHCVALAVPRGWAAVCVIVCPAVTWQTQGLVPPHHRPLRGVRRDAGPRAAPSPPAADPLRSAHPLPVVLGFQLAILTQGPHRSRAGRRAGPPSLGRFPAQLRGKGAQEAGGSCGFGRDGGFSAGSCQLEAISRAERASFSGPHTPVAPRGRNRRSQPARGHSAAPQRCRFAGEASAGPLPASIPELPWCRVIPSPLPCSRSPSCPGMGFVVERGGPRGAHMGASPQP